MWITVNTKVLTIKPAKKTKHTEKWIQLIYNSEEWHKATSSAVAALNQLICRFNSEYSSFQKWASDV